MQALNAFWTDLTHKNIWIMNRKEDKTALIQEGAEWKHQNLIFPQRREWSPVIYSRVEVENSQPGGRCLYFNHQYSDEAWTHHVGSPTAYFCTFIKLEAPWGTVWHLLLSMSPDSRQALLAPSLIFQLHRGALKILNLWHDITLWHH